MDAEPEVTEDPNTWPAWLRQSRELAHEALRAARKRRRDAAKLRKNGDKT